MHHFPGITFIGLQQEGTCIGTTTGTGTVIKDTFAAAVNEVSIKITGRGFGEFIVVGGEVTINIHGASISDIGVLLKNGFLY